MSHLLCQYHSFFWTPKSRNILRSLPWKGLTMPCKWGQILRQRRSHHQPQAQLFCMSECLTSLNILNILFNTNTYSYLPAIELHCQSSNRDALISYSADWLRSFQICMRLNSISCIFCPHTGDPHKVFLYQTQLEDGLKSCKFCQHQLMVQKKNHTFKKLHSNAMVLN